jgi:hypothetical protein
MRVCVYAHVQIQEHVWCVVCGMCVQVCAGVCRCVQVCVVRVVCVCVKEEKENESEKRVLCC